MDPKTEEEIQKALESPYNKQYTFVEFSDGMSTYVSVDDPTDFLFEPEDCNSGG